MATVELVSPMQVAAVGVYPWSTQPTGLLNITCGLYLNSSQTLSLLVQTIPIVVNDFTSYTSAFVVSPMALYFPSTISVSAGQYVVGCWWTWTGSVSFQQAQPASVPTNLAVAFSFNNSLPTWNYTAYNGQLPTTIGADQLFTEVVTKSPGTLASLISVSQLCPSSSSSSSGGNDAAAGVGLVPWLVVCAAGIVLMTVLL